MLTLAFSFSPAVPTAGHASGMGMVISGLEATRGCRTSRSSVVQAPLEHQKGPKEPFLLETRLNSL